ncbi:PepSY domain-containing protein [Nitrosomonas communis]|uniref:Peptidase propeptide and YPEB domain-containing protein n=1 Tax=Nitrosomonas communis TaxID=44574 RepID=A0A1H2VQ79_9PROT|nr:PepSY domain-containing protein [Nitrosomonas communis]SDW70428.1 Peptidase propeptide and YPEB domain-containing protein [Nitrosomonas communis]
MNVKNLTLLSLLTLLFATSSFAGLFDEKVEMSQVPEKVQQAITQNAQGGTIQKVEKGTMKKKVVIYEATVKKPDGKEIEIKVEEDGTLVKMEDAHWLR